MAHKLIPLSISLLFLLFPFLVAGLICLRVRKNRPASASRTNKVTKITETIILLSVGFFNIIYFACIKPGSLLQLDRMRTAYATAHLFITGVAGVLLLLAALLSWKGRTSWAVVLITIMLFFYSITISPGALSGPSYLMTKIAPKDSWEPIVNYTFEVNDGLKDAEVWINGVFLGTTPFEITAREFNKKVPFLNEPPEGFSEPPEGIPQEEWDGPKGNWFKFKMIVLDKREDYFIPGISYSTEHKNYYAKIGFSGEWGKNGIGVSGGGSDNYKFDYTVSLKGNFPTIDKINQEKQKRFQNLVQKARLADYRVEQDWLESVDTYGKRGWEDIQELVKNEEEFSDILDEWVQWKYDINESITQQQAENIFNKIYDSIDKETNPYLPTQAINLIYYKLNLEELVKKYEKIISKRSSKTTDLQKGVIRQAVKLWDTKLNTAYPRTQNIIEKKIVPMLIVNNAVDSAITYGGPEIERFLIRQYQRNTRIEGIELGSENSIYTMGMHLNKWLLNLAYDKSPAAREFCRNNRDKIMELADLMINNNFNRARTLPEFLFEDIELGEKSLAYQYWPEYSVQIESSFPPWWQEKLIKRWEYLNQLDSLATEEMYIHCWKIADLGKSSLIEGYLQQALEVLPHDKKIPVTKVIIKDILEITNRKRQEKGLDINAPYYFAEDECVKVAREFLAKAGDGESFQWLLSRYGQNQKNYLLKRLERIIQNENTPEYPLLEILAKYEDPALRILPLEAIRRFPTPANRKILEQLLNDDDELVRNAAEEIAAELDGIKNISFEELVSEPESNEKNIWK